MVAGLETSHKIGILIVAGVFIAFALLSSFVFPKLSPDFPGKHLSLFVGFSIGLTALMLGTIIWLAVEPAEEKENEVAATQTTPALPEPTTPAATTEAATTTEEATTTEQAPAGGGDAAAGKQVFESSGCASCHTLADAGAAGTVGPNLDEVKPSADHVVERVTEGKGVMPSFKGQLSEQQIQDVAAYVSSVAGS